MANQNFRVKHGLEVGTAITATASSGILTATEFHGDGSNLTNINAGNLSGIATNSNLLEGQNGSYYLDYANFSGIATDSDKLDGQQGTYYLDYANFSGIATDSDKLDGQQGSYYLDYANFSGIATDSSLLDGIDSGSFLRSDVADTKTGVTTFSDDLTVGSNTVDTDINILGSTITYTDVVGGYGTEPTKFYGYNLSGTKNFVISVNHNTSSQQGGLLIRNATDNVSEFVHVPNTYTDFHPTPHCFKVYGGSIQIRNDREEADYLQAPPTLSLWNRVEGSSFTSGDEIHRIDFVAQDASGPGSGTIIRIADVINDTTGADHSLKFFTSDTPNGSPLTTSLSLGPKATELYYLGGKKLETTDAGATVTGILTATTFSGSGASLTNIPTSSLVGLATDSDKLDGQQGSYYLNYSNFSGIATDSDKLDGQQGTYYLDYANFSGIATDSSLLDGLDSTQFLRSDAADTKSSGDLTLSDDVILKLGDSGDGNIVSTGSTIKVYSSASAGWEFYGRGTIFKFGRGTSNYGAGEDRLIINTDAGVELYHGNTGSSTKRIETTNSGANVIGILTATESTIIGTTLPTGTASQNLQVTGNAYISANLGIGVTNSTHKLSVSGDINLNNNSIIASDGGTSNIDHLWHSDTSAYGQGGVWHFVSDSTYKANGTSAIRAGAFVNMADTGTASQKLQITGGAYVSGDVGIGATNPTAKLDVDGTLNVSGVSTFQTHVHLGDSDELRIGASNDLKIYHNTNSQIINYTGALVISSVEADKSIYISADNGAGNGTVEYIRANGFTGEVNLSHYGTEKFATKSNGIAVSGIVTATSGIVTYYGDGSNLSNIVTNITAGSNISIAENPTGNFIITATSSGGMTELLDDTSPQLGGDLDTNGNNIVVQTLDSNNNNVLNIGSSSGDRMQIYKLPAAQGGHTVFSEEDANGSLIIKANQIIFNNQAGTEIKAQYIDDGSCILYHDNSRRIRTTGYGVSVYGGGLFTGISTFEGGIVSNGNATFGDDDVAIFGNGLDLFIYHAVSSNVDYTNESYITAFNHGLNLEANSGGHVRIKGEYQNGTLAKFNDGGAAELYHDGSKKLETTNAGVTITGITTSTSFVKASNSGGFLKADGTEDTNTYLTSETSHADVLVDGDFTSNGFMKRIGAGTYAIDNNTYLTSYAETDTLDSVTTRGSTTTNNVGVGTITATKFVKSGGQSTEFLKADGSVDSSTYLTSYSETDTLDTVTGRGNITTNTIEVGGVDLLDLGTLDFGGTSGGARDVQVFYDGTNSDFEITLQSDVETMTIRDGTSSRVAIAKTTGKVTVHGPVQVGAGTSGTTQELLLQGGESGQLGEIDIYKTDYILGAVGVGNTISFFSLDKQKYRAAKVSITVRLNKGSGVYAYQYTELMIMHDSTSTNAFITEVNTICTEEPFAVFESPSAANSSTSMYLWCRNTSSTYVISGIRGVATCIAGI